MIHKYAEIFCWKNVSSFCSAKATHIFSAKNIRILYIESAKTVNEMTLNELVKLTTLWTTGPWIPFSQISQTDLDLFFTHSQGFLQPHDLQHKKNVPFTCTLQRLVLVSAFHAAWSGPSLFINIFYSWFCRWTDKALIRLHKYAGWSGSWLYACDKDLFSSFSPLWVLAVCMC